jgi:hypothetical protein
MLPPSDSINHHSLKLAEFVANLQTQVNAQPHPPPPYVWTSAIPINDQTLGNTDEDDEGLDVAPISVKIDTSINMDGQGNTIVIPTSIGAEVEEFQSPSAAAIPTATSLPLQQLRLQRQVKSAQLASTIIAALKTSGALQEKNTGTLRPIEIIVNSGIHIKGSKNILCACARKKLESYQTPSVLESGDWPVGGKRRACSVR